MLKKIKLFKNIDKWNKKKELVEILKKQLLLKDKNPFVENFVSKDIDRIQKILKNSGYYFSSVNR